MGLSTNYRPTVWSSLFVVFCSFSNYASAEYQIYGCFFENSNLTLSGDKDILNPQFGTPDLITSFYTHNLVGLKELREKLQSALREVLYKTFYDNMNEMFDFHNYYSYQRYKANRSNMTKIYKKYKPVLETSQSSVYFLVMQVLNTFREMFYGCGSADAALFLVAASTGITRNEIIKFSNRNALPRSFKINHVAGAIRVYVDSEGQFGYLVVDPGLGIPKVAVIMDDESIDLDKITTPDSTENVMPVEIQKLTNSSLNFAFAEYYDIESPEAKTLYYLGAQLCSFVTVPIKKALPTIERYIVRRNIEGYPLAKVSYKLSSTEPNTEFSLSTYNGDSIVPHKKRDIPFHLLQTLETVGSQLEGQSKLWKRIVNEYEKAKMYLGDSMIFQLNQAAKIVEDYTFVHDLEELRS